MGSRSKTLIDSGANVLFAFEEAIGFMFGSNALDKVCLTHGDPKDAIKVCSDKLNKMHFVNKRTREARVLLKGFLNPKRFL